MLKFEEYLNQFTGNVNLGEFLINLLVTAILSIILREFYIRHGKAVSNRKRFASIFLPLAMATMLIITIVKSSIALSLGLVGALSIVRFRAAIKDPEELTYLFLVIGIGLAAGANQSPIAIIALISILALLYIFGKFDGGTKFKAANNLYLNISTEMDDLEKITSLVTDKLPYVDLKRFNTLANGNGLDLTFVCRADSVSQLDELRKSLQALAPGVSISVIDQPDLIA